MRILLRKLLGVAVTLVWGLVATGQDQSNASAEPRLPLIQMENVPLADAIANLAQQAELNFTVDPAIMTAGRAGSGNEKLRALVKVHWENLTAEAALARLLKERDLFLVKNPQTGVAKITGTNSPPRVFAKELFGGSKEIIPRVQMSEVPLETAFAQLAAKASMKIELDAKLTDASVRFEERIFVSVRFRNLTASQALAAICDQYDLQIAKSENAGAWRVSRGK